MDEVEVVVVASTALGHESVRNGCDETISIGLRTIDTDATSALTPVARTWFAKDAVVSERPARLRSWSSATTAPGHATEGSESRTSRRIQRGLTSTTWNACWSYLDATGVHVVVRPDGQVEVLKELSISDSSDGPRGGSDNRTPPQRSRGLRTSRLRASGPAKAKAPGTGPRGRSGADDGLAALGLLGDVGGELHVALEHLVGAGHVAQRLQQTARW